MPHDFDYEHAKRSYNKKADERGYSDKYGNFMDDRSYKSAMMGIKRAKARKKSRKQGR